MVHKKLRLDEDIPEMMVPSKTQSLTELGMGPVLWKREVILKFICLKYYFNCVNSRMDTNSSKLKWT